MRELLYIFLITIFFSCKHNEDKTIEDPYPVYTKIVTKEDSIAIKLKEVESMIESNDKIINEMQD